MSGDGGWGPNPQSLTPNPCPKGLICLSGCSKGEIPSLLAASRYEEARAAAQRYLDWFGRENFYLELQNNLCYGDRERNKRLVALARGLGIGVVATNNVHYHQRERHRLQDALVAIRHCKSLDETHRERRPNSEFFLKSTEEMSALFAELPEAVVNTALIAERCAFDLVTDLDYRFPDCPVPEGYTTDSYLEKLCLEAAARRYGEVTPRVRERLEEELRLVRKHRLSGFFLIYHDILKLGREVAGELGLAKPDCPLEEDPPGRSRGSSVALLIGYLIGLSHIDPLLYNLSLERFLHEDLSTVPDVDLDFARNIREGLIKRVHEKWGWQHAALTGMIDTYQIKGAIRDLGKALGISPSELDRLAKKVEHRHATGLAEEMGSLPEFKDKVEAPGWKHVVDLARELDGFPKYLAQHPGGMIISSRPLIDLVPVLPAAMEGRYICQWDKDSIDDAHFVKIDFLALGALSQIQECLQLIEERHGRRIDLSRIDFEDREVYKMMGRGDNIGIFQVESAAQLQTITRLKPQNLVDMAIEVALVRPGVGATDSTHMYLRRKLGQEPVAYDHPLEKRALERTLGAVVYQDQVNQLAIDVAGFSSAEADQLRRAFGRRNNKKLIEAYWQKFKEGAASKVVSEEIARKIFGKFNGQYMFPESHAYAFGVTAYQAAWLKCHYPLEFYVAIFNQQPMGFYNLETLKEDARRHKVTILNPDINLSQEKCIIDKERLRLGFLSVQTVGEVGTKRIVAEREARGPFRLLADVIERAGLLREALENLADAGTFDALCPDRRAARWEIGLRYKPPNQQLSLGLPVEQDMVALPGLTPYEKMAGEYRTMALYPQGHLMAHVRKQLKEGIAPSYAIQHMRDGQRVKVAGLVIRRQRPGTAKGVIFLTLEDEFGHVPIVVWPKEYQQYRLTIKEPLLLIEGFISRRDGTMNVVTQKARAIGAEMRTPGSKDWG
ncbi:MAG: DNA polymerase III subunit alpha [Chloroflexi bacterium]|nr:DNA polymerase III subunit alpha [Chloroflexota bacterium]